MGIRMGKEFINLMIVITVVSFPLLLISIVKFIQGDYFNSIFAMNLVIMIFLCTTISYTVTIYLLRKIRSE